MQHSSNSTNPLEKGKYIQNGRLKPATINLDGHHNKRTDGHGASHVRHGQMDYGCGHTTMARHSSLPKVELHHSGMFPRSYTPAHAL